MTDIYLFFGLAAIFGFISLCSHRDETIKEQRVEDMKVDHMQTCHAIMFATRNEAERMIDGFYGRWSGLIDEWELSNRTAGLYKCIISSQKRKDEIERRNNDLFN
jgi:hypothetical protein